MTEPFTPRTLTTRMITDPTVLSVIKELHAEEATIDWSDYLDSPDPFDHVDTGFSISGEQGDQLYLLARYGQPRIAVEFATSLGFSTLFVAAALRDAGAGGMLYTAELVPEKAEKARENVERAGLADYVTFLVGDARETLKEVPDRVELTLIDGWAPEVSLEVLKVLEPKFRSGAVIFNDNQEQSYMDYVRTPGRGYRSMSVPSGSSYKPTSEVSMWG